MRKIIVDGVALALYAVVSLPTLTGVTAHEWLGLAVLVVLGLWGVIDFNGLFAAFHSLFFVDGTWTFNYDSLLISMYPIDFWMGMGAVWVGSAISVGLLCFAAGCLFAWKAQVQHRELEEAAAADAARSKKRKKGRK